MSEVNLKECNLILEINGNCCLGGRGDFIIGYKIEYPEKYSLSAEDLSNIQNLWHNAFKHLPSGTIVVKTDIYLKKEFSFPATTSNSFFQKVTNDHFTGRNYLDHTGYLFFVHTGLDTLKNHSIKNPFIFPKVDKIEKENETLEIFKDEISQAEDSINRSSYFKIRKLAEKEFYSLYQFWFGGFNEDYVTDIEFTNHHLKSEEKKYGIVSITNEKNLPKQIATYCKDHNISCKGENSFFKNNLDSLAFDIDCNHIYNQVIFLDDHKDHLNNFLKQESALYGARNLSYHNGQASTKLKSYLTEIQKDEEFRYVRGNNTVIFWSDDKLELLRTKEALMSVFRAKDIKPYYPSGSQLRNLFYNNFFTNVSCLDNNSLYISDLRVAITFFTNTSNYKNTKEGILFNDRIHNIPVMFDFWDRKKVNLQSRNFILMAPTGGGKSVTNEHIIRQLIEDDVVTVIADLGDSYLKFSKLLPAEYISYYKYTEGQPIGLNPFAFDNELTTDRTEEVCEFVWTLIKREEIATEVEKTSLRKIVNYYYSACIITNDSNYHWCHFYDFIKINKDNLFPVLEIPEDLSYFNMEEFLHNGSEFMPGGSYAFLFADKDSPSTENYKNKKLILFEFGSVTSNRMLLNIMLLSMTSAIRKSIWNDKTKRGVVFFDEFAKQLEFPSVLDKVKFFAQAIRKQEGSLGLILQSINQLPDTPAAKTIIDNTETFIYLNMRTSTCMEVKERLKLTEHQFSQLTSVENNYSGTPSYSEIFISRGNIQNVYRIELPKPILYAFQTEGAIHDEMMARYEKTQNMEKVIEDMMLLDKL